MIPQPSDHQASSPEIHQDENHPGDRCSPVSIDRLPACPVCGGRLVDIRQKRQCERCHTICETCCEGGRG